MSTSISRFFRRIHLWFVRSMSGSKAKQVKAICIVIGSVFILLLMIESIRILCHNCHTSIDGLCGSMWAGIRGLISIFIDPGSVWNYDYWEGKVISNDFNVTSDSPGILSLIVSCVGMILFVGFLVSFIYNMISRDIERFREGRLHYYHKNHIVIIGFTEVVPMLVKQICRKNEKCEIVVQSAIATNIVRNKIFAELTPEEEERLFIVNAKRDSIEELEHLCLQNAEEVYVVGDENEDFHDSMNLDCLGKIVEIIKQKNVSRRIVCKVFFNNQNTFAAFQSTDIKEEWKKCIDFQAYNFYDEWARRLFVNRKWNDDGYHIEYPSLDRGNITPDSQKHVHLVIIGMNSMGISVGTMASHLMHFPNFFDVNLKEIPQNSTVITFIDSDAATEMNYFRGRFSGYFDICGCTYRDFIDGDGSSQYIPPTSNNRGESFLDIRYEFIRANVEMPEFRKLLDQWANAEDEVLSIAVCLEDASKAIAAGLYLPESIYWKGIPVFIRQEFSAALLIQLGENNDVATYRKYRKVYPFGMLDICFDIENEHLRLAKLINGLYEYCSKKPDNRINIADLPNLDILEKESEEKWKELSVANQWSNLYASYSVNPKLTCLDILEKPSIPEEKKQMLALIEHARWNMEKLLMGFRAPKPEELDEISKKEDWYKKRFVHRCIDAYRNIDDKVKQNDLNIVDALEIMRHPANTQNNKQNYNTK